MVCHEKVVKMPWRVLKVHGENELKRIRGFTPRRRMGFRMELVQGATPICEGSCRLTSLERQEVWNDCRSCKVRVGSNGNLLWEAYVLLGRKKGGVRVAREDNRGVTKGRKDVREVFQQHGSGAKRKLSRCGRNQMGNEPILALPEGADNFVVYYDARSKDLKACLEKREKVIACISRQLKVLMKDCMTNVMLYRGVGRRSEAKNEFEIDVRRSDLEMESGSYWLDKVRTSIWRDVRTLAIEEAYTTKYSIHPGADTMLCGFRLTNRWLSMKKDIASCGSKYLAYLEVEVEYQGSSGLLLQPETSMVDFRGNWNTHFREMSFSLRWGLSFEYGCASFEACCDEETKTILALISGHVRELDPSNFLSLCLEANGGLGIAQVEFGTLKERDAE
ncbi:hypothetical protein Tco_0127645 [Tanacetum coccineum]